MTNFIIQPWRFLVTALVGIANEEQQHVIEYFRTENQVLKEKIGKKRILLDDDHQKMGGKSCSLVYRRMLW